MDRDEGTQPKSAQGLGPVLTVPNLISFTRLLGVVSRPFDERPGLEGYAEPAPAAFGPYRTYCGT